MFWSEKMKPPVKFHLRGNHHSYYGIFLMAFGLFNWYMGIDNGELVTVIPLWQAFIVVGIAMVVDDMVEHTWTGSTPLRYIHEKFIIPLLRG